MSSFFFLFFLYYLKRRLSRNFCRTHFWPKFLKENESSAELRRQNVALLAFSTFSGAPAATCSFSGGRASAPPPRAHVFRRAGRSKGLYIPIHPSPHPIPLSNTTPQIFLIKKFGDKIGWGDGLWGIYIHIGTAKNWIRKHMETQ